MKLDESRFNTHLPEQTYAIMVHASSVLIANEPLKEFAPWRTQTSGMNKRKRAISGMNKRKRAIDSCGKRARLDRYDKILTIPFCYVEFPRRKELSPLASNMGSMLTHIRPYPCQLS